MQNEIEILKVENDWLKVEIGNIVKFIWLLLEFLSSIFFLFFRQLLGFFLNNLNIMEVVILDILLDDVGDVIGYKDGCSVKIIVFISKGYG